MSKSPSRPRAERRLPIQVAELLLSAALFPLCFPPFDAWPLLLLALPLLLHATSNTSARKAFYLGLVHGSLSLGLSLSWLFHIFGPASVVLFLLFGLFSALFCLLNNALLRHAKSTFWHVLIPAILWLGFEFFRCELFLLRFPWITPGTAIGPTWLSPLLGVYGMTFLTLLAAAALVHRNSRMFAILPIALVFGLGIIRPAPILNSSKPAIRVTVIQDEEAGLIEYIEQTRQAITGQTDVVIWPEYAIPMDVRKHPASWNLIREQVCAEHDTMLLVGTKTDPEPGQSDWYNTALLLDAQGTVGEYYKARPLHFFDDGKAGTNLTPHVTELGRVATPICFDGDYTEVMRRMTVQGAEFFAVPVFDAKHWTAREHLQHAVLLRCRAAENGRWIASAASSGVSQFIDPHGHVHLDIAPMMRGAATYNIHRATHTTFFVRAGWLFPWINLVAFGGLAAFLLGKRMSLPKQKLGIAT